MRPDSNIPRRSGPSPRTPTTQKQRGRGPLPQSRKQRGFGLVAAMFLIIVIAGAIAAMWRMSATQSATSSLALQQARAYQAARAGLEWGIHQVMKREVCNSQFSPDGMDNFSVKVSCSVPLKVEEEGKALSFYNLESTAQYLAPGNSDYAYRKLEAVIEVAEETPQGSGTEND